MFPCNIDYDKNFISITVVVVEVVLVEVLVVVL